MLFSVYAHAQNTPDFPYLGSWQQYSVVPMGDAGNDYKWKIYNNEADAENGNTPSAPNSYELISLGWVKGRTVTDNNAYIEILFDETIFTDGDTWYLVYEEYSGQNCIARRSYVINITENSFYVDLPISDEDCNNLTGDLWDNSIVDISSANTTTLVDFSVKMYKDENFTINSWQFTGSLGITSGSPDNSINSTPFFATAGTTGEGYNWSITGNAASFTLTVTVNDEDAFDEDEVSFTVQVVGDASSDYALELDIDRSTIIAKSGGTYIVETGDNGSGNYTQTRMRLGIPNTGLIAVSP